MEAVFHEFIFSVAAPFIAFDKAFKRGLLHVHDHFVPHPRNNYHPHILGHRALALSSLLLVTVKIASIVIVTAGPVLPAYSSAITVENIVSLTNQSRQENNLKALSLNNTLSRAAQSKAEALLACNCFQHDLPDGRKPWDFIKAQGYSYISAGENLAVDFTQAENVESAWMNSPGHRANILNKNFEEIGIGISQGEFQGHSAIFVVQMFGTPMSQPIKNLDEPTLVAQAQAAGPAKEAVVNTNSEPQLTVRPVAEVDSTQKSLPEETAVPASSGSPLEVTSGMASIENSQIKVTVTTQGDVAKVLANYEGQAIMLDPRNNGTWEGLVDIKSLTDQNKTVSITAYDVTGKTATKVLGSFSEGVVPSYNLQAEAKPVQYDFLGWQIDPKQIEYKFYLIFTAVVLTSLVMAIAIKRHVQHIKMVANASFAAIFAMLLLLV